MWPFTKKTLEDRLEDRKTVRIAGLKFKIRKINPTDHLAGLDVLQKIHSVYKVGKEKQTYEGVDHAANIDKIRKYCTDILLAGVVEPKLSAKEDGEGFYVGKLFTNMPLAQGLTVAIIRHTYKKKLIFN